LTLSIPPKLAECVFNDYLRVIARKYVTSSPDIGVLVLFAHFLQILILTMQLYRTANCVVNYLCRIGKHGSESEAGICITFE